MNRSLAFLMGAALLVLSLLAGCNQSAGPDTAPASPAATPITAQHAGTPAEPSAPPAMAVSPEATAAALPSSTATPGQATATPADTPTSAPATAAPAAEPLEPEQPATATVTGNAVNLRAGPGTTFPIVGQASSGQRYPALGRNAAGDWWQIDVAGQTAWVSAGLASIEGDSAGLPVIAAAEPAVQPAMPVRVYETQLTIPTYRYAAFTSEAVDPVYGWPYRRFDREAYEASNPRPVPTAYRAIVLENEYLKITVLPDLGGRIYQVIFKPTGSNQLYQNPVIKPSHWGPVEQGGWLAAGGIEWGLPVPEHGYAWGDRWGHITNITGPEEAAVTVFMTDERNPRVDVDVILRAGEAAFTIQPRIVNTGVEDVAYQFWLDAMLAPGPTNSVGPNLRFVLPTEQVTVHSRGDDYLPAGQQAMAWPIHNGVDYSRLGNWSDWLGVFERPAAHGPFAGVYDPDLDEGVVRVFPPAAARGSKIFAMGWAAPIDPGVYTDDGSAYVELQGGVSPTYWDRATLAAGDTYSWQETWFPVAGISGVSYADGNGALYISSTDSGLTVGVFPVRAVQGRIEVEIDGQTLVDEPVSVSPAQPWQRAWPDVAAGSRVSVRLFDQSGEVVIDYEGRP